MQVGAEVVVDLDVLESLKKKKKKSRDFFFFFETRREWEGFSNYFFSQAMDMDQWIGTGKR